MSIKIYDGMRIPRVLTCYELSELWREFEAKTKPVLKELHKNRVVIDTIHVVDTFLTTGKIFDYTYSNLNELDLDKNFFGYIYAMERKIGEILQKETRERYVFNDFTFDLSVYPMENQTLLYYYSEQNLSLDEFSDDIELYGYWNNSDKPDSISEEEWEQRKNDWNEALDMPRLKFTIGQDIHTIFDAMDNFVYDEEDRARRLAIHHLVKMHMKENEEPINSGNAGKAYFAADKWSRSDDAKVYVDELTGILLNRLPAINEDLLKIRLSEIQEKYGLDLEKIYCRELTFS